eukprot:COSAG01_NODE_41931_length_445_cov_2.083815_1_plen_30_part_10
MLLRAAALAALLSVGAGAASKFGFYDEKRH